MEPGRKKSQLNVIPFLALSVSMVAFAIMAILLLLSVTEMKNDSVALKAQMEALKTDLMTVQNNSIINGSQKDTAIAEIQDIKARMEALEALKGQMERLQSDAAEAPGLSVESFELKHFTNAGYSYETYSGTGTIRSADTKNSYLVLLQKTLKSGGAPTTKKLEYVLVLVVSGTGTFYTDDSAEGAVTQPDYDFKIIGSVRIEPGVQAG